MPTTIPVVTAGSGVADRQAGVLAVITDPLFAVVAAFTMIGLAVTIGVEAFLPPSIDWVALFGSAF